MEKNFHNKRDELIDQYKGLLDLHKKQVEIGLGQKGFGKGGLLGDLIDFVDFEFVGDRLAKRLDAKLVEEGFKTLTLEEYAEFRSDFYKGLNNNIYDGNYDLSDPLGRRAAINDAYKSRIDLERKDLDSRPNVSDPSDPRREDQYEAPNLSSYRGTGYSVSEYSARAKEREEAEQQISENNLGFSGNGGGNGGGNDRPHDTPDHQRARGGSDVSNSPNVQDRHDPRRFPVALDLNNDGEFSLVDYEDSTVFFDSNNNGFRENVSWIGADDGFLVIDKNGDGQIVGDELVISDQTIDDNTDTDLEALATLYDTNKDGIFDSQDVDFTQFKVWQDLNQDGLVNDGELKSLADWGIQSINLSVNKNTVQYNSHQLLGTTFLTKIDGSRQLVGDLAIEASSVGFRLEEGVNSVRLSSSNDVIQFFSGSDSAVNISLDDIDAYYAIGSDLNDQIKAGLKTNVVIGGAGGDDFLEGSSGNDWLSGDAGADSLIAGKGHDVLFVDSEDVHVDGGEGFDIVMVSGGEGVALDLEQSSVEAVFGNSGNDDFISSGDEDLTLSGEAGDDRIRSGEGNDLLIGGGGSDLLHSGAGDDRLFVDAADFYKQVM